MTFPAAWKTHKLGKLAQYINGKAFKPADWKTSGRPIIRIQNLTDSSKPFNYCDQPVEQRYYVNDGDLLISWSATLGSFIWDRGPAVLNQHIFKAIPNAELVERDFLMLETLDEIASHAHGIAMKHITKGKFEAIEVAIPSLAEQRRIVARIKECMDRVEEIERLRIQADDETRLLLRAFYRDLYLELVKDGTCVPLHQAASVTGGGTPSKQNTSFWNGNIPWVSPKDMKIRDLSCSVDRISEEAILGSATKLIDRPSVLFVVRGMILAHTMPVAVSRVPLTINQDMKALTPKDAFDVDFLATMIRGAEVDLLKAVEVAGHGTRRLQTENWASLPIPLLSMDRQHEVVSRTKSAEQLVDTMRYLRPSTETRLLRESVLRKAFDGEL